MSRPQVKEEMTDLDKAVERIEQGDARDETDEEVVQVEVKKLLDKVIPVWLPADKREELRWEARELGIGPTTLLRMWILERLRQRVRASMEADIGAQQDDKLCDSIRLALIFTNNY